MDKISLFLVFGLLLSSFTLSAAGDDPDIKALYAVPNNPLEDSYFDIYVRAEDNDGIDKIKFYNDGSLDDTEYCDGDDECTAYFEVYESKSGYHTYKVRVYDEDNDQETDSVRVYVRNNFDDPYPYPYPYDFCGDGYCNNGETYYTCSADCNVRSYYCGDGICSIYESSYNCPSDCGVYRYCGDGICSSSENSYTCSTDCGAPDYCGDGTCSSSESCSTCISDCGTCPTVVNPIIVDVLYTCAQRGGECCDYGGNNVVDGAADCPSSCFTSCNPRPYDTVVVSEPVNDSPTGAAVGGVDTSLIVLVILVLITLLLLILIARG